MSNSSPAAFRKRFGPRPSLPVIEQVGEMEELHDVAEVFRSHPRYVSRVRLVDDVQAILRSARSTLLD